MPADLIILNARVLTMNAAAPRAEAVAIIGNRLAAVGSHADIAALWGPATRIIDAGGKTVLPGFIESHMHIFHGGASLSKLSLADVRSFAVLAERLRAYAAERPDEPIISGIQATYQVCETPLDRHVLDRILSDRPLAVHAADGHTVWANTMALEKAGILHGRTLLEGNEIVMGPDGLATGLLLEHMAFAPIKALQSGGGREGLGVQTGRDPVPPPTAAERAHDRAAIKAGLDYCARFGITSFHNMDGSFYQLDILEEIDDAGELPCRVRFPFHHKNDKTIAELERDAPAMRARSRPDRLSTGFVKIFVDGVIDSMTAMMVEDYAGHPGKRGLPLFSQAHLDEVVIAADRLGFQVAVHSVGDAGVRRTLDAYAAARMANGVRDSRHRVEHIEALHPADLPRFHEMGVIASMQPLHVPGPFSYDGASFWGLLGEERLRLAFAWRSLLESGASLCFASDWPVSPVPPMLSIAAAVGREPPSPGLPNQAVTLHEALAAYTTGGAYAEFAEDRKGQLKVGFLADIVMLDRDIESLPLTELSAVNAALTICDGRVTYEA